MRRIAQALPVLAAATVLLLTPPMAASSFAEDIETVPSAPQNLTATPGDGRITLTWGEPEEVGGAWIFRYEYSFSEAGQSSETIISTGMNLSVTVDDLTNGTEYVFAVRAANNIGESVWETVRATPAAMPDAPQDLTAAPGDGQVALFWNAPADDGGAEITGYQYRYAEGTSVPADTDWNSADLFRSAVVSDLTNGTVYAFEVRAVNSAGEGAAAAATATPEADPVVIVQPDQAAYRFSEGAGAGSMAIVARTEAGVRRPNGSFSVSVSSRQVPGGATSGTDYRPVSEEVDFAPGDFSDVGGAWEARKTVALTIVDDSDAEADEALETRLEQSPGIPSWVVFREADGMTVCGSDGCLATVTIADNDSVPSAPQNLSATPGHGAVTLAWEAPANSGGSAISGYEYRHAEGASVPDETAWTSAGTAFTATVGSLTNGTAYAFEVRAVNSAGEGGAAALTATPSAMATAPGAPQNLSATPGDGEVTLTWVAPESNGGATIDRYEYRHAEGASVPAATAWTSAGTALTATVSSLNNGTAYAFEVRAVNNAGDGDAASATAAPAAAVTAPDVPRELTAAPGDRKVTLKWQAPASDGGLAIDRYEYRYTLVGSLTLNAAGNTTGNTTPAGKDWTSVGTDRTVTTNSLANGTKYAFEVRAVNGAGPGGAARTTVLPATEPDAPRDFRAIPGDGRVTLRWKAPVDDGGSAVFLYLYRYAAGPSVPSGTAWKSVQNALTVAIDGLANGAQYAFELRAVNRAGTSDPATATATPLAPPSVAELQRHIAGFMLNRANALANNQPRLTRFLRRGGPGNSLTGRGTERQGAVRVSLRIQDVWLDLRGAWSFADGAKSRYSFGTAGSHWRLNEQLLAGLMVQFDMVDESLPGRAGEIAGTGWLAGPYFAAKLEGQPLFFEGRLLYGRTDNRLDHARGVSGKFGTARWLAQFRMEGEVDLDTGLALNPFADLTWTRDRQRSFADSLGRHIGGQTVSLGQAKVGIDFRLPLEAAPGTLALTGGAAGVFSTIDGGAAGAGFDGARARLHLGLDYRLDDAYGVGLKGYYDGIGAPGYRSYGLAGELKIRF